MAEKLPPHDLDSEEALLGSLLIDGDAIRLVESKVKPQDFYQERHQWLYEGCLALRSRREGINQITLAQELDRRCRLEACGGVAYLSHLVAVCPTSLDIEYYADIVYRLSVNRQVIALGNKITTQGYSAEPDVNKLVADLSDKVSEFRKIVTVFDELVKPTDAANMILDMVKEYESPPKGMSWGFRTLDDITGGIFPEFLVIGARPSTGKTQVMLDVTERLIAQGFKILFCSSEMMIRGLLERKVARELRVDIKRLRRYDLDDELLGKLADMAGVVSEQQVYYLPRGVTSQDIYSEALKLKATIGLDIVFVDYLQILEDCWRIGRESKNVLVGRASKVLKSLVNELQIPVICASQLNRDVERRVGDARKPTLADLRESGDIEQDADVVFLLWRDMEDFERSKELEIKMAKNRQLGDAPAQKLVWVEEKRGYYDMFQEPLLR